MHWLITIRPIFFGPTVVLLSFMDWLTLVRLQIDSNTTGSQKKIRRATKHLILLFHFIHFGVVLSCADSVVDFRLLVQIFFLDPVVLELICYCTRAKRLINKSNTTGWLKKCRRVKMNLRKVKRVYILTKKFCCDPVVLESICYYTREKRLINEGNTTGGLIKIWMG